MSATEKEWLRAEQEWLQREDERLLRLYGAEYVKWLAGETDLERVAIDVGDKYDRLLVEVASTPLRVGDGKGTDLPRVEELAWVSVRCRTGLCKRRSLSSASITWISNQ